MMRSYDEIYADVPDDQREELRRFRETHPEKALTVDGHAWSYIDSGSSEETLLLLVGGLRMADAAYRNIPMLDDTFRVIAPSYPAINTMAGLADGIASILRHEKIGKVHVLAGSFGGMLAQVFIRRHTGLIDRVVLSTTAVLDESSAERYRQALAMVEPTDEATVLEMAKVQMLEIIAPPDDMRDFYRAYLDELFSYRVDKDALASTYRALLDFADNVTLSADDLDGWMGDMLVLESADDATFDEATRARVRALYPRAKSHVFENAGHSPATTQRDLYFRVVKHFLLGN